MKKTALLFCFCFSMMANFTTAHTNCSIIVIVYPLDTAICSGSSVLLSAGSGSGLTYKWYTNTDTSTISATDTVTVRPTFTTTYYVAVSNGTCSGLDSIVVAVNSTPFLFINVTPPSGALCSGMSATLRVDTNGTNYTWTTSFGLNKTTGDSVIATPAVTTTYTVTGNDSLGCIATGTIVLTIDSTPALIILPQPPPIFCSGLNTVLSVEGAGSNFTWTPSTGLSGSTGDSVITSPLTTITYTVIGLDSYGCPATGSIVVTVIPSPNKPTYYQHGDTLTSSAATYNQWYLLLPHGDSLLVGDTNQYIIDTCFSCCYYIIINSLNGCSISSDTLCGEGIKQVELNNSIQLFPNPFTYQLFIKINPSVGNLENWTMQLTDVLGRTIYNTQSLNYSNEIDLSKIPSGIYFISITNKTGKAVFPIVKQE